MKTKKGFTLIELLVVIAIIALLLSILVPGLGKAKEKAQSLLCQSNLKQWNMIVGFFLDDNKGVFPDSDWNNTNPASHDIHGQWWIQPFKQYMNADNMNILFCGKAKLNPGENYAGDPGRPNEFHPTKSTECWGSRDQIPAPTATKWTYASYAPNAWMMDPSGITWGGSSGDKDCYWGKRVNVASPYQVPLFLDSRWVDVWPTEGDRPDKVEYPQIPSDDIGTGSMQQLCHTRHSKMTNVVFMDGSSQRIPLKDLWGLKWHKKYKTSNDVTTGVYRLPSWVE